jgi:hypothetical protein
MTETNETKVLIQIGDEVIELKGKAKEEFETDRQSFQKELNDDVLKIKAKEEARASALAKLAALGLTEQEIAAL